MTKAEMTGNDNRKTTILVLDADWSVVYSQYSKANISSSALMCIIVTTLTISCGH